MSVKEQKPIVIFRGDNTAAFDLRTIKILLTGDLDLTNAAARFDLLGFTKSWTTEEVATGELSIVFDAAQTKAFALGPQMGTLRLFDMSTGTPRQLTVVNKIPFFVTNSVCEIGSQSYGINVSVTSGETIHIEFNVGLDAVEGKADKVEDATAGDLASLTEDGNLLDSGIPADDVQRKLTFDTTPTEGSQNPVTSDGIKRAIDAATPEDYDQVKSQVEQNTSNISTNADNIATINSKIPSAASASNKLADKNFVNSSIATNTATFRGTYNAYSELNVSPPYPLTTQAEALIAAAIAAKLASFEPPVIPENNDYCFVQIPRDTEDPADFDPTVIDRVDRYKCTVTESGGVTTRVWEYEWSLNNSSFTSDQWAAINSGVTSGLVDKLANLPTAEEIEAKGYVLFDPSNNGSDKNHFNATSHALLVRTVTSVNPVSALDTGVCKGILISPANYMAKALGQDTITTPVVPGDPLYAFITSGNRALLTSVTVYLRVGSVNTDAIRLLIKSADGETTLATSSYASATSLSTFQPYVFSLANSDVWLDAGTQYRFEFEYSDLDDYYLAAKPLYPTLKENAVYTFDNNAGVKWSLITEDNGAETVTEVSDKCVNMGMGGTVDVTITLSLANLMDVGIFAFSPLKKYAVGDRCVYGNVLYECKSALEPTLTTTTAQEKALVKNHFTQLIDLGANITIGKSAVLRTAHNPNPSGNIIIGLDYASAAGTNNVIIGKGATAYKEEQGQIVSDATQGNIVIGENARADDQNDATHDPWNNVVIGKQAKAHGQYSLAIGNDADVFGNEGTAIGTRALAANEGTVSIGTDATTNPDWVKSKAYAVGESVVFRAEVYKCIQAVFLPETTAGNTVPSSDTTHWELVSGATTIRTHKAVAIGQNARASGENGIAVGADAKAIEPNSIAIGNGAKSNGQGTATLAISALNKFYLGTDNIVDLINAAVNTAIQNQTIAAAVSTTTATGGGRRLLAAATPTSDTKTEVTPSDIGALGNTGGQTLDGWLSITGSLLVGQVGDPHILTGNEPAGIGDYVRILDYEINNGRIYNTATLSCVAEVRQLARPVDYYGLLHTYRVGDLIASTDTLYKVVTEFTYNGDISWLSKVEEATIGDVLAAIRTALDAKAPLASPAFTGTPTAPTPTAGDNSTKVATTAFVKTAVDNAQPNLDYVMRVNPETGEIYYTTPDANANA